MNKHSFLKNNIILFVPPDPTISASFSLFLKKIVLKKMCHHSESAPLKKLYKSYINFQDYRGLLSVAMPLPMILAHELNYMFPV